MSLDPGALAAQQVAAVRDDPAARLAALSCMDWQARRGVLNPLDASPRRQRLVAGG